MKERNVLLFTKYSFQSIG